MDITRSTTATDIGTAVDPSRAKALHRQALAIVSPALTADPTSPDFHEALDGIRNVGRDVVEESSVEMDSLRDRKVIPDSGQSPAVEDANAGLARIRDAVVDLDPSGTPSTLRGRLSRAVSKLPGGAGLRAFAARQESAGKQVEDIAEALDSSLSFLRKDETAILAGARRLWDLAAVLVEQDRLFADMEKVTLDNIEAKRAAGQNDLADAIEGKVLRSVRSRQQDILVHAAAVKQFYLTLTTLRDTSVTVSDAVTNARYTSLQVMRMVAGGEAIARSQAAALDQSEWVTRTTGDLLRRSAENLESHVDRVGEMSSKAAVSTEDLRAAFESTHRTIAKSIESGKAAADQLEAQVIALRETLSEEGV